MGLFLKYKYLLLSIFFAVFAGFPLLSPGLPPTHDGEYHVIRFYEFDKVLKDGNLYPRWAPDLNNGYGVPLFNYVYPFPNYFASFLHLFGISFIDAFKLSMFFASIIGAIFMFLWSKQFWGNFGGIVSSVFYTYAPYHFLDIYVRGSVGEVWALAFAPAVLWSITRLIIDNDKRSIFISGILLTLIIFSHNILALMFTSFLFFYTAFLILQQKNKKILTINSLSVLLTGVLLSAIFWIPALLEKQFVTGLEIYDIKENFPDLYQLLIPSWGTGFSGGDIQNQMSFQIGIANLTGVFMAFLVLLIQIYKKNKNKSLLVFFLLWFLLVFLLMLDFSLPVWEKVPFLNYFQFPWRFLSLETLIAAFLAGGIIKRIDFFSRHILLKLLFSCFMILFAVILSISYTKPAYYHNRDDNYYVSRSNFIDGTNSPGNYFNTIWFDNSLKKEKEKIRLENGEGEIKTLLINPSNYKFSVLTTKDTKVIINAAFFPGWKALVNGRETIVKPDKDGLILFNISKGESLIEIKFSDTNIRRISTLISIISLFSIFILLARGYFVRIK